MAAGWMTKDCPHSFGRCWNLGPTSRWLFARIVLARPFSTPCLLACGQEWTLHVDSVDSELDPFSFPYPSAHG